MAYVPDMEKNMIKADLEHLEAVIRNDI